MIPRHTNNINNTNHTETSPLPPSKEDRQGKPVIQDTRANPSFCNADPTPLTSRKANGINTKNIQQTSPVEPDNKLLPHNLPSNVITAKDRVIQEDESWEQFKQRHDLVNTISKHRQSEVTVDLYSNKTSNDLLIVKSDKLLRIPAEDKSEILFYERVRSVCDNEGLEWPDYLPEYYGTLNDEKMCRIVLEYIPPPSPQWIEEKYILDNLGYEIGLKAIQAIHELNTKFNLSIGWDLAPRNTIINSGKEVLVFYDFECSKLSTSSEPKNQDKFQEEVNYLNEMCAHLFSKKVNKPTPSLTLEGDYSIMLKILKYLASIAKPQQVNYIFKAIKEGNLPFIKLITQKNLLNEQGINTIGSPLAYAIFKSQTEVAKALITPDTKNQKTGICNASPLWWAVYHCREEIVDALINSKADLNAGSETTDPLSIAYHKGYNTIAAKLYEAGADTHLLLEKVRKTAKILGNSDLLRSSETQQIRKALRLNSP